MHISGLLSKHGKLKQINTINPTTYLCDDSLLGVLCTYRSADFKMSYWFHRFDQKTNEIFLRISALEVQSKKIKALYYTN